MKVPIFSTTKTESGKKELPVQFSEEVRPDLIKRAVLVVQANRRQAYGAAPEAGKRASAKLSRRRKNYKTSYGYGISRVPRKIFSRMGRRMSWQGAFAPGTVGGRRAHPPKAEKIWAQKINTKERRKAIRSALAAVVIKDIVNKRGHKVPDLYPFIIEDNFEKLAKTKELIDALVKLGIADELKRLETKTERSGKGKLRGRRFRKKVGPLFVVSGKCSLMKAAANLPGIDVVDVKEINAELLAPGAEPGRMSFFTIAAIEKLEKEKLFL